MAAGAREAEEVTACSEGVDWQPAGTPLSSATQTVFLEKAFSACASSEGYGRG